jgi:3-hexulose-6-phosphate synthase/6-phospho-3-hexuloisomerase
MIGKSSLDLLEKIRGAVHIDIAVAGGLDAVTAPQASARGADIVIVGGAITRSADVRESAKKVREALDAPGTGVAAPVSTSDAVKELFSGVSTPNVSDAMHRKGAMAGIGHLAGGIKMVGKSVTVQSFAGDWAKPVEAIDQAGEGDVLVINNEGSTGIATWGELATLSAISRRIEGVVIDGAVRDIDNIRKLPLPVFARAVVPNAGEPKGFGEINCEILCGGQVVRPGDWIIGDESGVVVIPRERAYEIARRAREVKKTEERVREEIKRGSTLSKISELVKWEKK